jgi:hypothetical protein
MREGRRDELRSRVDDAFVPRITACASTEHSVSFEERDRMSPSVERNRGSDAAEPTTDHEHARRRVCILHSSSLARVIVEMR